MNQYEMSGILLKHSQIRFIYDYFYFYFVESCDRRIKAYKNGRTLDECKEIAKSLNSEFKVYIEKNGKLLWTQILDKVDHDELVYKFTLKFLRQDGYDIGNYKIPEVKKYSS